MPAFSSLWDFAASLYQEPGVQPCFLRWQDQHRVEVSLLLWAIWLDVEGLDGWESTDVQALPFAELWQLGLKETAISRKQVIRWRYWRRQPWFQRMKLKTWLLGKELQQERKVLETLEACSRAWLVGPSRIKPPTLLQSDTSEYLDRKLRSYPHSIHYLKSRGLTGLNTHKEQQEFFGSVDAWRMRHCSNQ